MMNDEYVCGTDRSPFPFADAPDPAARAAPSPQACRAKPAIERLCATSLKNRLTCEETRRCTWIEVHTGSITSSHRREQSTGVRRISNRLNAIGASGAGLPWQSLL